MKALLAAFILAVPLPATVKVVCAPSPMAYSKAIFDHRSASAIQHWGCVLTNVSVEPALVSEAAVQGWMMGQGISAISSHAIRIGATEIKRRGKWATAGRLLTYGGTITAALAAGDVIQIGAAWGAVAGFTALQAPALAGMLAAREPDGAIFERLAMEADLALGSGQSVSIAMFAAPMAGAKPVSGQLMDVEPGRIGPDLSLIEGADTDVWAAARDRMAARTVQPAPDWELALGSAPSVHLSAKAAVRQRMSA